jgi:hypothetical protein
MRRAVRLPRWMLWYVGIAGCLSALPGLALDCANAANCGAARLHVSGIVAGTFLVIFAVVLLVRFLLRER